MDVVVLIIVCRAGYSGSLRGVWVEALRLLSIAGAVAIGANVLGPLAGWLANILPWDSGRIDVISFFSVTALALIGLLLLSRAVGRLVKQHAIAPVNKIIGAALGAASGVLVAGLVAWGLTATPWSYLRTSVMQRSGTGPRVIGVAQTTARLTTTIGGRTAPASHVFGGA